MPHPYAEEPQWEHHSDGTSFTRPLLGAEYKLHQMWSLIEGSHEVTIGISFSSSLLPKVLEERVQEALGRLRFCSPLVAARIVDGIHPGTPSWLYTPAQGPEEVNLWAKKTLRVSHGVEKERSYEAFVAKNTEARFPYVDDNSIKDQYFYAHLLLGPDNTAIHGFFLHASHAIIEAGCAMNVVHKIIDSVTRPTKSLSVAELAWGDEWENLSPGPITAVGGVKEGWDDESVSLFEAVEKVLSNPQPTHSLKPQRTQIEHMGRPTRAHRVLDKERTTRIAQAAKALGFTMTQLWEAAHVMAVLAQNAELVGSPADQHVTIHPAIISHRHLIQPLQRQRDHVGILCVGVALDIPYSILQPHATSPRDQLIAIMKSLKAQYAVYLNNPHIAALGPAAIGQSLADGRKPPPPLNPHWGEITSLGIIERRLPTEWRSEDGSTVDIREFFLGLRQTSLRPITHTWAHHGQTYLQIQASDIWDQAYFEEYLDRMTGFASLL